MLVIRKGAAETLRPQLTRILYGEEPMFRHQEHFLDAYLKVLEVYEGVELPSCAVFFRPFHVKEDRLYAVIPDSYCDILEVPNWVIHAYDGVFVPAPGPADVLPGGYREVLVHTPIGCFRHFTLAPTTTQGGP